MNGEVAFEGDYQLQGVLELPESGDPLGAVVVSHPHPQYGGTMAQPVVYHVARACRAQGLATLRFNFRGVGESGGTYGGGVEYRDVHAAASYLRDSLPEGVPIALAGYSFGAWMSALAVVHGEPADALAFVAFPLMWGEIAPEAFEGLVRFGGPVLALCGSRDEIAPPGEVDAFLHSLGLDPTLKVMHGEDHFFMDSHDAVGSEVAGFLRGALRLGPRP